MGKEKHVCRRLISMSAHEETMERKFCAGKLNHKIIKMSNRNQWWPSLLEKAGPICTVYKTAQFPIQEVNADWECVNPPFNLFSFTPISPLFYFNAVPRKVRTGISSTLTTFKKVCGKTACLDKHSLGLQNTSVFPPLFLARLLPKKAKLDLCIKP